MIERLKRIKETLASCIEGQLGNLKEVDAKELGEVVDMVKDLEEAIYYCTITKSMEEAEKKEKHTEHHYYTPMYYRDMDRGQGRMYYPEDDMMYYRGQPRDSEGRFTDTRNYSGGSSGGNSGGGNSGSRGSSSSGGGNSSGGSNSSSGNSGGSRQYRETEFPVYMRDEREGRSPMSRKMYMESKEMHKDKATKIRDLENYAKELGDDIVEMIQDASPEEKQTLEKKLSGLATKIAALNNGQH